MSDLFMNMHHRRLSRATASKANKTSPATTTTTTTTSSFNSSRQGRDSARVANSSNADGSTRADEEDALSNILSLQLRKPKHWKWELSTSRSCSNIALPRILLHNHKGELLVDLNSQEEQVLKEEDIQARPAEPLRSQRRATNRAATSNLAHSIRRALDREFDGLQIQEATPSPTREASVHSSLYSPSTPNGAIDFYSNDLPNHDYSFERRSNSLKGVRFKVDDHTSTDTRNTSFHLADLPTPPPSSSTATTNTTPTTPTTASGSSSGPREKRRYRRSQSSGRTSAATTPPPSRSILERFSFNKGRFSSPEYAAEHEVTRAPRYYLSTSKAGTLVVAEDSFSRCRRRRMKPRNSSSENVADALSSKSRSTSSLKMSELKAPQHLQVPHHGSVVNIDPRRQSSGGSLQNVTGNGARKKMLPVRRYRSDGNVLLHKQLSTSEEEEAEEVRQNEAGGVAAARHQRKYSSFRRQSKRDLDTIEPSNGPKHAVANSPTSR